jgi:phytoene desaturase
MSLIDAPCEAPRAIVIGAGLGGLAAGLRLRARGYEVVILEKLDQPGGRASVFTQDGFTFDAGPTIVTAPFLLEELWALFGKRLADDVTLRAITPFYRIRFDDGRTFSYSGDAAAMREQVAAFCTADVGGYERFVAQSKAIFDVGFTELVDQPFHAFSTMLRTTPDLIRLESYKTVYSLVSSYIRDPYLRTVFSFHPLLIGGNPFAATSIFCLISYLERQWGVHYAMGGTGTIVQGMARLLVSQGGTIRLNAEVKSINVESAQVRGVTLVNGEQVPADIVISNADSAWTYRHLIAPEHRRRWTNRRIARAKFSMGLFVWYFGTNRQFNDVEHHTILLGPRYKGLLDDIFKHHKLADDFSLYLHRPTATDPSMAPPECDAFYVLSPVPNLASGTDWQAAAESYRQRIEEYLNDTIMPGLSASIVTSKMMTPADFQTRLNSYAGAAFSYEPILTQSAWFRPHNKSEDIRNLFLVGAGTHPGAGMPGVIASAKVLDRLLPTADRFIP